MKQLENVKSLSLGGNLQSLLELVGQKQQEFTILAYGFSGTTNKKGEDIPTMVLGIMVDKKKYLTITRSTGLILQFKQMYEAGELDRLESMTGHIQQQKFEKDGDTQTTWKFVAKLPEDLF